MGLFRTLSCGLVATSVLLAQSSFWGGSTVPSVTQATHDSRSVTLGLKFQTTTHGNVTAVRFYKGLRNTGPHEGALWTGDGRLLGSVVFAGQSPSGWQEAAFPNPIAIQPNTTYVVSYLAPNGNYAINTAHPWASEVKDVLRSAGPGSGVYAYGSALQFPTSVWVDSNYWVDVVFVPGVSATPSPTPAPSVPSTPSPSTFTVSGVAQGGAILTLMGPKNLQFVTGLDGLFTLDSIPNGSYVLEPRRGGVVFSPPTLAFEVKGADVSDLRFSTAPPPAAVAHSVSLRWDSPAGASPASYNVYRAESAGGAFVKLNTAPILTNSFEDAGVQSGRTYYYVATSVDARNVESLFSNQAAAGVPYP
jgi:hypothetical protein